MDNYTRKVLDLLAEDKNINSSVASILKLRKAIRAVMHEWKGTQITDDGSYDGDLEYGVDCIVAAINECYENRGA